MSDDELAEGILEYREYQVSANGETGNVAIALGDPGADTLAARIAKGAGAQVYGLVSILGLSGAPRFPAVWVQSVSQFGLTVADADQALTDELWPVVVRCLSAFIVDVAPMLAWLRFKSEERRDRALN